MVLLKNMQLETLLLCIFLKIFKLQKYRRVLFYCFRFRIRINNKIVDMVLLFLIFTIVFPLLLMVPLQGFVLLKIIASVNKIRAICGT